MWLQWCIHTCERNYNKYTDKRNKNVAFKNCLPFTNCISAINNTQMCNGKDLQSCS